MKALTVTLAVTTVAFGGMSAYLLHRLQTEEARAKAEVMLRLAHETRLKQLEETVERDEIPDAFGTGQSQSSQMPAINAEMPPAPEQGPPRQGQRFNLYNTPQGREMMRLNSKVANKRLYADLIEQLKLKDQEAKTLLDVLASQQEREFEQFQQLRGDRAAMQAARESSRTQAQAEAASVLGAQRAQALADYQASLGERMQVQQMADQLDALSLPLQEEQRERLVAVMVEEREVTEQPEFDWNDPNAPQTQLEWRELYNRRVLDRASSILTSDQYREISEIQAMQNDLQRQAIENGVRFRNRPRGMNRQFSGAN